MCHIMFCSSSFCKDDRQFSCAAADRSIFVHRPPSESAEEHDVLYSVLLSYGSHFLHPFHVHGERIDTHTHSYTVYYDSEQTAVGTCGIFFQA